MDSADLLQSAPLAGPERPGAEATGWDGAEEVERPSLTVSDVIGSDTAPAALAGRFRTGGLGVARQGAAVLARPRPIGVMLFGLGMLLVLVFAYIYSFTALSAQRSQHELLQSITGEPAATYNLTQGVIPAQGRPVAVLEVPALQLFDAVVQGSDAQDLRSGPGHMPGTPLPGQPGNAVIAGRRATYGAPFGGLASLRTGEMIRVVDGYGVFRYRVSRVETVTAAQRDVVTPTTGNHLTLVTANSDLLPSGRLAVVARLVGAPVQGTGTASFRADPSQLGLEGDAASGLLALAWSALFLLLLTATAWLLRNWSQPTVVYLLALPILIAVGLFACESMVGFLPATV